MRIDVCRTVFTLDMVGWTFLKRKRRSGTKLKVGRGVAAHGSYALLLPGDCPGLCPMLEVNPLKWRHWAVWMVWWVCTYLGLWAWKLGWKIHLYRWTWSMVQTRDTGNVSETTCPALALIRIQMLHLNPSLFSWVWCWIKNSRNVSFAAVKTVWWHPAVLE